MGSSVLIIDESDLFREFLKERLSAAGLEVEAAINGLDGSVKIRSLLPDLVVMDYSLTRKSCREVLEEKGRDANAASIPVLLTAQKIERKHLLELAPFKIRRVIMKPIKIDALFAAVSEILGVGLEVDATPCMVEAHVNDDIVFVEIAKGLNREKIDLLRFKIAELVELYSIRTTRILAMLSDMELSFVDGANLEHLLRLLVGASSPRAGRVKLLTNSPFAREFVQGRPEFSAIEAVGSLQAALDGLLADVVPRGDTDEARAAAFAEGVLSAQTREAGRETIDMRFEGEARRPLGGEAMREAAKGLSIAVVDDDFVIQELVKTTFGAVGAAVTAFSDGAAFLEAARKSGFDLVLLDLLMPGLDGFQVLARLRAEDIELPVVILSAVGRREAVIRALQEGVRSYLVKPLKPDEILRKTLEVLKANF